VTKVGRDAPYSLAELAQYVDLATPATKPRPIGLGRNVEVFDRLRRWAYTAIADWRIGKGHAWHGAVARRAGRIAADVGAESPRGPLKQNEDRSHRQERGALVLGALRRRGAAAVARGPDRGAARAGEARQRAREAARERSRRRWMKNTHCPGTPASLSGHGNASRGPVVTRDCGNVTMFAY